jgi:2,3-bisphosphoglycerate-dependent phosphoglycerate mutase
MRRALDTAVPVARALGLPLTLWPEIHEAGGAFIRQADGSLLCLPGSPRSFFESNYPEIHLPGRIDERGWWQGRPLETAEERRARAARFLDELLALHGDRDDRPEQRVAVFSHGEFFVHFMSVAFQMNARQGANGFHAWLFMNNTALARIDVRKSEFLLCYTNRVDHLPAELIT